MVPALLKKIEQSVNVRSIAVIYLASALFQWVWWGYFLTYNYTRTIDMVAALFQAWLPAKIIGLLLCVYLVMFTWVSAKVTIIGISLLRLSLDRSAVLKQSDAQRRRSLLAIACIGVTLIVIVLMPGLKDPDGVKAFLSTHISAIILFGYNLLAIHLYEGQSKR